MKNFFVKTFTVFQLFAVTLFYVAPAQVAQAANLASHSAGSLTSSSVEIEKQDTGADLVGQGSTQEEIEASSCTLSKTVSNSIVVFEKTLSSNASLDEALSDVKSLPLSSGTYDIQFQTTDSSVARADVTQGKESAYLAFLNTGTYSPENIVATTQSTKDLTDKIEEASNIESFTMLLEKPSTHIVAVHSAFGISKDLTSNDMKVVCVSITPTKKSTGDNKAPIAMDDSASSGVSETMSISVFKNDSDPDGDDIDIAAVGSPSGGTILKFDAENGIITYQAPGTPGTYLFDYTITDGLATDVATVSVVVDSSPRATIVANKVVCDDEADLPNWGPGGPDITSSTASDFVAKSGGACHLVSDWDFQWAAPGTPNPGDTLYGEAGKGWTTFSSTGKSGAITTSVPVNADRYVWVREVLQRGYIPFSYGPNGQTNKDDVSAEMYCSTDVLNYDNYDRAENLVADITYYCVAFNTLVDSGPGNDAPIATDDSYTMNVSESRELSLFSNDYDPDGDDIDVVAVGSPSGGTIVKFDAENGIITYQAPGTPGTYLFDYTITDGLETDVATVTIVVEKDTTPNTGSLRVCKVALESDGDIFNGKGTDARFELYLELNDDIVVSYDTPLDLNADLFRDVVPAGDIKGVDSECITYKNLPLDQELRYSEEDIYGSSDWKTPLYNDGFINGLPMDTSDFFPYGTNLDSDGKIFLTEDRPDRTVVLRNQLKKDDTPPGDTGTLRLCKMVADSNGRISDGSTNPGHFGIYISGDVVGTVEFPGQPYNGTKSAIFNTPLDLNGNAFVHENVAPTYNAECYIATDLPLGTYNYDKEDILSMSTGEPWLTPKYHDGHTGGPSNVNDFFPYGANTNADGVVNLTKEAPYRTIVVLNTYQATPPGGNHAPTAVDDDYTANPSQSIEFNILLNDFDVDGDDIDIAALGSPSGGTIVKFDAENGIVQYLAPGAPGTYIFDYTITDGSKTDTATVTITVQDKGGNPPVANNDGAVTRANTIVVIDVLANDFDPDGDAIKITDVGKPSNGTVSRAVGHRIQYAPNRGFTGVDTFSYTITDNRHGTDTAFVRVTVRGGGGGGGENDKPIAVDDNASTSLNTATLISVLSNDSDPDGDTITIESFDQPTSGTTEQVGNDIRYTPNTGFTGVDTFEYTITDGDLKDKALVTVTITNGGGGGGGGGGGNNPPRPNDDNDPEPGGEVLGDTAAAQCGMYLNDFLRIDLNNDPVEVTKLQAFLVAFQDENIAITGVFDLATDAAVRRFQVDYNNDVLNPWGYADGESTGYVYITTRQKINELVCDKSLSFNSAELAEMAAFRVLLSSHGIVLGASTSAPAPTASQGQIVIKDIKEVDFQERSLTCEEKLADTEDELALCETSQTGTENVDGSSILQTGSDDSSRSGLAAVVFSGLGLIFSVPFLLLVLGILLGLLVVEFMQDRKVSKTV